jgi:hypothetical protein
LELLCCVSFLISFFALYSWRIIFSSKKVQNLNGMDRSYTKYCFHIYKTRRTTFAGAACSKSRTCYCLSGLCCRESRSCCHQNKFTSEIRKGYGNILGLFHILLLALFWYDSRTLRWFKLILTVEKVKLGRWKVARFSSIDGSLVTRFKYFITAKQLNIPEDQCGQNSSY